MVCAVLNMFVMFIQKALGNHEAVRFALLNMVFCAMGMILHFLRLKKPKA